MDPLNYIPKPRSQAEQLEGLGLFAPAPPLDPPWLVTPTTEIEQAFQRFHVDNPHVFQVLEREALRAQQAGVRRLGIAKLVEDVRHDAQLRTHSAAFKLNNNFRAPYARLLIHRHPQLAEILATRERRDAGSLDEGAAA